MDHGIKHNEGYFDDFNPQFERKELIDASCKVCLKYFPSKKLKDNHRKNCHPYSREDNKNNDDKDDEDVEEVMSQREIRYYAKIERLCDDRDGQYLADMSDGSKMWCTLPDDDERVEKYLEKKGNDDNQGKIPFIKDLTSWNMTPWVPEDYKAKNATSKKKKRKKKKKKASEEEISQNN